MAQPLKFQRRWGLIKTFFLLTAGFALTFCLWFWFVLSPLQKVYLPAYMALRMAEGRVPEASVWWIRKTAPKRLPELAHDEDVVPAALSLRRGLPLKLSPAAQAEGWTGLVQTEQTGPWKELAPPLATQFFAGESVSRLMLTPLCGALILFLIVFLLRRRSGAQSRHEERHGRRTKGPELVSALASNRSAQADGIQLRLQSKLGALGPSFRIPKNLESSHILLMGDTGSGKSNAIRQILRQVQERGESAIVYDPAGEFVQEFYRPERGDLILNPLDERCPYWSLSSEMDGPGVTDAVAAALLPERDYEKGFFTDAPRRVLARLLRFRPTPQELHAWMADPDEIDRRLAGTPQAAYLDPKAGPQRSGVLASLNMIADSFALLPEREETRASFATERWGFERTRWVFLTSRPSLRERILPLHSVWLDLLILRMMEPCANPAKPVWFVLDELASLNKLPQLHAAVTENRKYGNPVVLGFQGRSQLEKRYGHDAEAMLSQPATKIFFKTSEPRAAKWISETLGEIEVERLKESRSPGLLRAKRNYAMEIATKPLVMASEIAGLEPLSGYIKQENRVVPVKFALVPKRSLQPEFVKRKLMIPEPRPLPSLAAEAVPAQVETEIANSLQSPRVMAKVTASKLESDMPLFVDPDPRPAQSKSRKTAFKKDEGPAREWKPVD